MNGSGRRKGRRRGVKGIRRGMTIGYIFMARGCRESALTGHATTNFDRDERIIWIRQTVRGTPSCLESCYSRNSPN